MTISIYFVYPNMALDSLKKVIGSGAIDVTKICTTASTPKGRKKISEATNTRHITSFYTYVTPFFWISRHLSITPTPSSLYVYYIDVHLAKEQDFKKKEKR